MTTETTMCRRRWRADLLHPANSTSVTISPTIYVFPRQYFDYDGERVAGPSGLSVLGYPACGEDGTYAAVCGRGDYLESIVYHSSCAYDCFTPAGPWTYIGRLCDIRGIQILMSPPYADSTDYGYFWRTLTARRTDLSFSLFAAHVFRTMHIVHTPRTGVYLRVHAASMVSGCFVVYQLPRISNIEDWWRAGEYVYAGILFWKDLYRPPFAQALLDGETMFDDSIASVDGDTSM